MLGGDWLNRLSVTLSEWAHVWWCNCFTIMRYGPEELAVPSCLSQSSFYFHAPWLITAMGLLTGEIGVILLNSDSREGHFKKHRHNAKHATAAHV